MISQSLLSEGTISEVSVLGHRMRDCVFGFREHEPGGSMTNRLFVKTFRGLLRAALRFFRTHIREFSDELQPSTNLGLFYTSNGKFDHWLFAHQTNVSQRYR